MAPEVWHEMLNYLLALVVDGKVNNKQQDLKLTRPPHITIATHASAKNVFIRSSKRGGRACLC